MPLWQSIGIGQVSANFKTKYIGIGSVSKKWYRCITNNYSTYVHYVLVQIINKINIIYKKNMHACIKQTIKLR